MEVNIAKLLFELGHARVTLLAHLVDLLLQAANALLLKIVARSFMNRGADIAFLSAFPEEAECLYAPLTYLRPTGRKETLKFAEGELSPSAPPMQFVVLEVEAQMS